MRADVATLVAALALSALSETAFAQPAAVDAARLTAADSEPENWMSYGRTYDEQRFSPLDQINTETVGDLGLAWWMDLDSNRSQETTPLVIDGVMYITLQWSVVRAVDAGTGALLWEYDPEVPHEWGGRACCGADSRGVAAWNGKIFVGTVDGRLVAIDAATGERVWETLTVDQSQRYSISGAPRVAKGKVIIGNSGADFGVRGYVSAYDAETGELDWRFWTVPGDPADGFENAAMEMAAQTWDEDGLWRRLGGGGTVWDSIVYDPVTDLVFIGVGNGSPWPADLRSPGGGDHLFLSSIVALDPDDGSYVWHYQTTPNESWDYTATQPIMVADLVIDGAPRRVVMQAPKNGFFYVLDAATGAFISAQNYVPVNWASHVDPETGRPVVNPEARYDRTGAPTFVMPSAAGGHSWHPMAMSPDTGLVYIPAMYSFWVFALYDEFKISPVSSNSAVDYSVHYRMADSPDLPPEARHEYGGALLAWDPVAQELAWRFPHVRRGGGALATAGGLVFQGNSDGELFALRATDGEQLWSLTVHAGVVAAPITYEVEGDQYVAVAIGSGVGGYYGPKTGRLLAFKLRGDAEMPAPPPYVERPFNAPEQTASTEVIAHGEDIYFRNCAICHGVNGEVRGGLFPDLRRSFATSTPETFRAVVLEGALEQNGMRSFADALSAEDAEATRAYIISLAHRATETDG